VDEPVLIVGAGPVGLTMAMSLRRLGVDVRIIDKAAAPADKSKALVLWPRTLEMLDIQGCALQFVDAGAKVIGARILANARLLVQVRLDTARSVYAYALMIPQSQTELLLAQQLALLGVSVQRCVELTSFVDEGSAVSATIGHPDGQEETFRCAYLLGCDGAHSTVRHSLGVQFDGSTMPSDWLLADVDIDGDIPCNELTICWTSDGVLVFFPIAGKRFRVIADVAPSAELDAPPPELEEVQKLLDQRGPSKVRAHDPIWLSRFRINERKVRDYSRGRVFLAGDAAHVHSPAGGQGMNTGMQDAFNLAWKLAMVWHRNAHSSLLDSYSIERSAIGDQVLRNASNLTKVGIVHNPILREIRGLAAAALGHIPALRQRLVDQLTEIDLHYGRGPLTHAVAGSARRPSGGERAPDIALSANGKGTRLYEVLATGKFAVLSVGASPVSLPDTLGAIASVVNVAQAPGYDEGHIYLVRPDAYVAMSTREHDTSPIFGALEQIRLGS
jgi:2-polyprenyl-6-methoxyphenol hydroxylase-like FAD-dependent oxidoreductase